MIEKDPSMACEPATGWWSTDGGKTLDDDLIHDAEFRVQGKEAVLASQYLVLSENFSPTPHQADRVKNHILPTARVTNCGPCKVADCPIKVDSEHEKINDICTDVLNEDIDRLQELVDDTPAWMRHSLINIKLPDDQTAIDYVKKIEALINDSDPESANKLREVIYELFDGVFFEKLDQPRSLKELIGANNGGFADRKVEGHQVSFNGGASFEVYDARDAVGFVGGANTNGNIERILLDSFFSSISTVDRNGLPPIINADTRGINARRWPGGDIGILMSIRGRGASRIYATVKQADNIESEPHRVVILAMHGDNHNNDEDNCYAHMALVSSALSEE